MTILFAVEILGACFSIIYSLLLMRERIAGWAFGIAASILSCWLFYETKLYAQALVSVYYAGIGIYGWYYWVRAKQEHKHIQKWNLKMHLKYIGIFVLLSVTIGYLLHRYTDASSPLLDVFLTLFGFLASIKEARKILTSWLYWLVINIFSAWLYYTQGLYFYAVLMVIYSGICIPGYLSWLRIYKTTTQETLINKAS